ncbi:MAG: hypothetical protein L6R42_008238, partial [Xanthoria sp. 1 TBL-2021]
MVHSQRNTHRAAVPTIPGKKLFQEKPHIHTKKYGRTPDSSWSGTMGSHYLSIFTAWTLATVPMVILALAFSLVVQYSRPKAPPGSFYSDREQANISLGSAIYSKIPSTQLTFIASFSATLATTLLPALMALFSYTVAIAITKDSDGENREGLPSPYQLQLLISSLDGSLLALWSFALYLFSGKRRGVAVISNLWKVVSFFSTIALLALLIAMTDAWLNFSVSTVQFIARDILPLDDPAYSSFKPGRGLPSACIDLPLFAPDESDGIQRALPVLTKPEEEQLEACYSFLENKIALYNSKSSAGNMNQNEAIDMPLQKPEGWLLVPAATPTNVDFEATTFGSSTDCKVVTNLCDIVQPVMTVNDTRSPEAPKEVPMGDFAYDCKRGRAGLQLAGNASDLRNSSLFPSAGHGFVVQYYTDSTKTAISNRNDERGPQFWYAVLLQVPVEDVTNPALLDYRVVTNHTGLSGNRSVAPAVGLVGPGDRGDLFTSILSCATTLSDVRYSSINGSIDIDTWTTINQSTSPASVVSIDNYLKRSWPNVQRLVQNRFSNATSPEDVASYWESIHDRTVLTLGGMLIGLPPLSVIQSTITQVTRIPRAPFITLIVLDLVYAIIGTYLMVVALIAVRNGSGVRDAQARLSTLAVVAESFESPALGDDARDVNMLFAERRGRGESTRRVALVRRNGGGRRFKQIVVPQNYVKASSTGCEDCQVTLYCSESHRSLDEESHESSCKALDQAKSFLKDEEFQLKIDAYDENDDDFSRFVPIPVERLARNLHSYLNVPTYVAAGCQYIEALINTNTFAAIKLAAEKACEMLRCFPSDPMDLRSDLPGVYLRLGRDQEAYSLVKWWQLNNLTDVDIHKSYPVVPYLDITDADVFEQPSEIVNAIDGNSSLVNMFCVALIKIKILSDITVLQQIRALHQRLPPELVNRVEGFIPLTDAVRNNPQ